MLTSLFLGTMFGYFSWIYLDWCHYRRELQKLEKELNNDAKFY
jgi:hypothetical protein